MLILPETLETILYWLGTGLLILMLAPLLPFGVSAKFNSWCESHPKAFASIILSVALVVCSTLPLAMVSMRNKSRLTEQKEKEQLQEQCVEYHESHPDNWVICPVCEEKLD